MKKGKYATHWRDGAAVPHGAIGRARAVLRRGALSACSLVPSAGEERFVRCLYCHNVFDDQIGAFDRLLVELKGEGTFIDTGTCLDMLSGNRAVDGRYFHLSFDDGFRNNFTNAVPVLIGQGVPALFFVPSRLIDAGWETARRYCLEVTRYPDVIELLKWRDLEQMLALGFEVGSHTATHARLTEVSPDPGRLEDEVAGSKRELEERLGATCEYISWPYGGLEDVDIVALQAVRDAGYHGCFGAFRGSVVAAETDAFFIPRHHFEVQWPVSHVKYFARGNMEARVRGLEQQPGVWRGRGRGR